MAGPVLSPIPTLFTFINTLNNMSFSLNIAKIFKYNFKGSYYNKYNKITNRFYQFNIE